jgi:predicted RNA-binding Zn-ribbon protein involved in translation (DUF1610 family)
MEHLHFICPNTGRDIDAGIETELDTLLRIKTKPVRIICPVCGEEHEWRVRDAQLVHGE